MKSAYWDFPATVKFIHPLAVFAKPNHIYFAFESFICLIIFEGFNFLNFTVPNEPISERKVPHKQNQNLYFEKFRKIKSFEPEIRKQVNSGGFPDSVFFTLFAEMAKCVWDLHFLALLFDEGVIVFQVKKNSRFFEVYMECVNVVESDSSVLEPGMKKLLVPVSFE
ncbi:hypothetical protein K1719_028241 [Acacia pycnantha]|nr:hypothetical protein K1719_028241 [Acacia pycnantha]